MSSPLSRARSISRWKQCLAWTTVAAALAIFVYESSEVDDSLTASDRAAIQAFLDGHQISLPPAEAIYSTQVDFLRRIWSRLKLCGFCRGGKSLNVATNSAAIACAP